MSHLKQQRDHLFLGKLKIKIHGSFLAYVVWDCQAYYHKEVVIQTQRGSLVLEEWMAELKMKLSVPWHKHKRPQKLQL